jgi:hypothetical protein
MCSNFRDSWYKVRWAVTRTRLRMIVANKFQNENKHEKTEVNKRRRAWVMKLRLWKPRLVNVNIMKQKIYDVISIIA